MVKETAIDLGASYIRVFVRGRGIILSEPSVVAVDKSSGKPVAVGKEAILTDLRIPGTLELKYPLRDGCSDALSSHLIGAVLKGAGVLSAIKPRILAVVPCGITETDETALTDIFADLGIKKLNLVEQAYASAVGYGIDVSLPAANIIADIGSSTADIAVVALGAIEASGSTKIAGDYFDEALADFLRDSYNIIVKPEICAELRKKYGAVYDYGDSRDITVHGVDISDGLPKAVELPTVELCGPLYDAAGKLVEAINSVIERAAHDSIADIEKNGVILTGGACVIRGLDAMVEDVTGIKTVAAENASECAIEGAGKLLDTLADISDSVLNISRMHE